MNDEQRIPFYDLNTAARLLARIFITYDLAEVIGTATGGDSAEILADYHISQTAAYDILAHLGDGEVSS